MKLDLDSITLLKGAHSSRKDGVCALELVAWMAGEKHSDHPACVSPVLGDFCRNWNDNLDDSKRQQLKPYLSRLIGTSGDEAADLRRSWMAFDWLTRECGPAFMDLTPALHASAAALRALPEITDKASLDAALETIETARKESAAARDAAGDAARAAARAAAGAAAGDAARAAARAAAGDAARAAARAAAGAAAGDAARAAARAAARDAAGDAARAAARAAAGDAARAAARDAAGDAARAAARAAAGDAARAAARAAAGRTLQPVVDRLQGSAFQLLDRMIDCGKVAA